MKKWKKKNKHKKKSKSPEKDNENKNEMPKEIGIYHDFLVFDKKDKNNNLEFQDISIEDPTIKDWLILHNSPNKTQSRFSKLFEELLENDKKELKEEKTENKQNLDNIEENDKNNIINKDDKNSNVIINEDPKNNNIISENDNNIISNKIKNDKDNNMKINKINEKEDNNKSKNDNIIKFENKDNNINNFNTININNENKNYNNDNINNNNNIINDKNIDNDNNNININNTNNNDRNYSEALTKTTTLESNKFFSERNPSEISLISNFNANFPMMGPGSFEKNNNNIYPYGKKSIYSNYSGNKYQPSIYSSSSSGNSSRNDSELYYSTSFKSNFSFYGRNSSVDQYQPERKIIDINVDMKKVICLEDVRTTIMIKNIPNKFTRDLLLNIIDQNFKGTYDLFILPTDANRYKNFGYAFINFICSYYIPYFYCSFNGKKWGSTNSQKICEITYSKIQGRNNLLSHYSNKIIFRNKDLKKNDNDQKYIIPNDYKDIFKSAFPNYHIEEFKYYFLTKMPNKY